MLRHRLYLAGLIAAALYLLVHVGRSPEPGAQQGTSTTSRRTLPLNGAPERELISPSFGLTGRDTDRKAATHQPEIPIEGFLSNTPSGEFTVSLPMIGELKGSLAENNSEGSVLDGRFETPSPGRFSFVRNTETGKLDAGLLHADNGSFVYRIEPGRPDILVPATMDDLLCINGRSQGMPLPPEEDTILLPPEEHPTDEDVPDYQNGIISLQSKPGAPNVIYIDLDGEEGPFEYWGDFDVLSAGFTQQQCINVWRGVAEDFLPFDVNVTTDLQAFLSVPRNRRMRCIMTRTRNSMNRLNNAGGVALLGSFSWNSDHVCWSRATTGANGAMIVSHEVGHTLDLRHDGNSNAEYEDGYGSGSESWGPIMGAPYGRSLVQWSRGEYGGANNQQNDINIISNVIGRRDDLIGDVIAEASSLRVLPDGTVDDAGIIESSSDLDTYHFRTTGGPVSIKAECADTSPNVNMQVLVYDSSATLIFEENHPDYRNVTYSANLPAGDYYLKVGGAARTGSNSFPAYGSIGAVKLIGTIDNPVAPQRFTVMEGAEALSPLGTVTPWDDHGSNPLTYSISAGNDLGFFQIDPATGLLSVAPGAYITLDSVVTDWRFLPEVELQIAITDSTDPSSNEVRPVVVEVLPPGGDLGGFLTNADFEQTPFDTSWGNGGLATASYGLSGSPQGAQLNGTGLLVQELPNLTDFRLRLAVQPTSSGTGQTWQLDLGKDTSGSLSGNTVDTYPAVADTYLRQASSSNYYNENWGNDPTDGGEMILGGNFGGDLRPMLRFDLSGFSLLPGESIVSSTLTLTTRSSNAGSGVLVTNAHHYPYDFVEGTGNGDSGANNGATWNDPDGDDVDVPGGIDATAGGTLGTLLSSTPVSNLPGLITFPSSNEFNAAVAAAAGSNLNLILDPDRSNPGTTFGNESFVRMNSRESGSGIPTLVVTRSTDPLTYTPVVSVRGTSAGALEVFDGSAWQPVPGSTGALVVGQRTLLSLTLRKFAGGSQYDLEWSDPDGFTLNHSALGIVSFSSTHESGGIDLLAFRRDQISQGTAIVDQISLDALPAAELVNGDFEAEPDFLYWQTDGTEMAGAFSGGSNDNSLRFPWNVPSYAYQRVQPARDFTFSTRFQIAGRANPALRFYLHGANFGTSGGDTLIGLRVSTGGVLQTSIDGTWKSVLDDATGSPTSFATNTTYVVKVVGRDFGLPTANWDFIWYPASNPSATQSIVGIPFFESSQAATTGNGVEYVRFNQLGVSSHSYWIDDVSFTPVAEASPLVDSYIEGMESSRWPFFEWAEAYGISPLLGVSGIDSLNSDLDHVDELIEYAFGLSPIESDRIGDRMSLEGEAGDEMTITLVVRDDDPNLTITIETSATMTQGGWSPLDSSAERPGVDQSGVPPGFRRRVFELPELTPSQFARVKAELN